MTDAPGSWLTKLKPFQAVLVGGFLAVLLVLGLWGTGNYSLFGVLSVDNRTEDFEEFFAGKLANESLDDRRQYLERAIIAALNVAEDQPEPFDKARFITSLEPHLQPFDGFRLRGGSLRDRLEDADPGLTIFERQRLAISALRGIGKLAADKEGFQPSADLATALAGLDFVHVGGDDFVEAVRALDVAAPNAPAIRELLYELEGPFRTPELFLEAPGEFIHQVHELTKADADYFRHDVVKTLWDDAGSHAGIFAFERAGVEVRVDEALTAGQAVLCRVEDDLHGKQFFLKNGRSFAHVRAVSQIESRDCSTERLDDEAALTVWLSTFDAAQLLKNEPRPLQAAAYPIRGVVLRRTLGQDFQPLEAVRKTGDPVLIEAIADELRELL